MNYLQGGWTKTLSARFTATLRGRRTVVAGSKILPPLPLLINSKPYRDNLESIHGVVSTFRRTRHRDDCFTE